MAARNTPSKGGKPDKLMRDAIMIALQREATASDGTPSRKINEIAAKLVDLAAEGDIAAIKEVNDRVDGKAIQGIDGKLTHGADRSIVDLMNAINGRTRSV